MTNQAPRKRSSLNRTLMATTAAIGISLAAGFSMTTTGSVPAIADAVRVEAPRASGFADVVEKVSPAVVSVRVKSNIQPASSNGSGSMFEQFGLDNLPKDHPFRQFFREFRGQNDNPSNEGKKRFKNDRPVAQGSGFFISEDGYLVTNNHVVKDGTTFTVVMDDGTELDAKLIGADARTDLAVLKVEEEREFTYVDFAGEQDVRVGDWVVAVGNPFGLGGTVTAGIISGRGRDIGAGPYDDFIQIDAAVNHGNSGGPAFDLAGQVIGVNTAIFSPSGGNVGIAFAIPASTASDVVSKLISEGTVERGWLGVQIQTVDKDIAESLGLEKANGALVSQPQDASPADEAGVKSGDVIVAVDDETVESPKDLAKKIAGINPGKTVQLTIWRDGKSESLPVKLGTLPEEAKMASLSKSPAVDSELSDFGLKVTPSDSDEGLVVTDVENGSKAENSGIRTGDIIVTVNSKAVASTSDVEAGVDAARKAGREAVLVQIMRDDNSRFVALPIAKG